MRRIVAPEGATLPIGALLAVAAPDSVPDTEIEAFVAGFVAPEPAAEEAAEDNTAAPRDIEAGGRRLRVLDIGSGEAVPLVLVHGFGADLNAWMFNQPALAERRRVVAFDLPGHGGAEKRVGAGDIDMFAAAVADVLAALGLDRAHLVGHSMGGAIAIAVARRRPERVASLTLLSAAGLGRRSTAPSSTVSSRRSVGARCSRCWPAWCTIPALISRVMIEETLRYKRLDGVQAALETIAARLVPGRTPGGRPAPASGRTRDAGAVHLGPRRPHHPGAHAEALAGKCRCTSSTMSAICRRWRRRPKSTG